ncbi:hypothetical protein D3C76_1473830 [compost metagenome]
MDFTLTRQALHLTVVREARDHIVGQRVHLPPFLQIHGGVGLADFQPDIPRGHALGFLELVLGTPWPVPRQVQIGLGQAQTGVARCLIHQGL